MSPARRSMFTLCAVCVLAFAAVPVLAQDAPDDARKLDDAIAVLRGIDPAKLNDKEREAMSAKMDDAWETLRKAGDAGRKRILRELKELDEKKIKDDYFKLDVANLLWVGWRFDEVDTIASIWRSVPLDDHYDQAFHIAFEAAATKGVRALPLMKALLHDDKNSAFVPQHSMILKWPQPLEFIWGVYGPSGLPELLKVLETSKDPVELKSAVVLLAEARYLKALPKIREIARNGPREARLFAIEWLGGYGHPDDRDFLLAGLTGNDQELVRAYLTGLASYEDMSTASEVAKVLKSKDEKTRSCAIWTLANVLGADALKALHDHAASAENAKERETCQLAVEKLLAMIGLSYEEFAKMPTREADKRLLEANPTEAELRLKPGDKKLTRKTFAKACRGWIANNRITGGDYEWVESRHVLAVATPKDLNRMLKVRAAVYRRLSDECLYEVEILDDVIRRISRMRYRMTPGLCEKVQALPKQPDKPK